MPVFILGKKNLEILWTNPASEIGFRIRPESLKGIRFPDIVKDEDNSPSFYDRIATDTFSDLRIVFNLSHPAVRDPLLESGPERFSRYSISTHPLGEWIVIFFRKHENPLMSLFSTTFRDFLVYLDERSNIQETVASISFPFLKQGASLLGRPLAEIITYENARRILLHEKESLAYLRSLSAGNAESWAPAYTEKFLTMEGWRVGAEYDGSWKMEPGSGLLCTDKDRTCFIHLTTEPDLTGRDFAVTLTVEQEHPTRFALLFNVDNPSPWSLGGYTVGFNLVLKRPFLTLKKNSLFVLYQQLPGPPSAGCTLRVEKSGGLITLFLDGRQYCSYPDLEPLPDTDRTFGILARGPVRFTRFEIETRPARYDAAKGYHPPRLTLPGMENRVYEAHFLPVEEWIFETPRIRRAILFRDATELVRVEEDRDAVSRANLSLRKKDYFGFIGANPKILSLIDLVEKTADTETAVFIHGPTGSGKEVLAKAIHRRSRRHNGPLVKVDCSALPQSLMETELFGHERGAFTGAVERHVGKFETAEGGTLFLDEIGNLDLLTQAKLLNFLENHTISRVGGRAPVHVDVRVITATNSDLRDMVRKGTFREDLYYRINVVTLELPPLRDRVDDIPVLVSHFIEEINRNHNLGITGVSRTVMDRLLLYPWPGNVRELYNSLLKMAVLKKRGALETVPELAHETMVRGTGRQYLPEKIRNERILGLFGSVPFFSSRDCLKVLPVSLPTIQRDLNRLVKTGRLRTEGRGPSLRYFPLD